ncbi:MAG: DUF983 domain-containing protein [Acidimicrobiales bacterium]
MKTRPTPSNGRLFWRGLSRACAVCGQRRLTRRVVALSETCPRCGFRFERQPGHFLGAVIMSTIVTFGLILISVLAGVWVLWPDVDAVRLSIVPLCIAIVVPAVLHPTCKTLWVAIDLMMRPLDPGEALGDLVAEERPTQER